MLTTLATGESSVCLHISGTQTALFAGETADATAVLVKYTWGGDANLDGMLNGDDYFAIDTHVSGTAYGFTNGDFNYDGAVNGNDYFIIDSNISKASGTIPGADVPGASIPSVSVTTDDQDATKTDVLSPATTARPRVK